MITLKHSPQYVHSNKYIYSDAFCFTNTCIMYNTIFQSLLVRGITKNVKINRPMLTNRQKVLSAVIRSSGAVINVRNMVKNIRKITTQTVKGKKYYYEMCHLHALIIGKW